MTVNIRTLMLEAMRRAGQEVEQADADDLAAEFVDGLRSHGLAIHRESTCIRLPGPTGRPMTTAELIMVGLEPSGG